MFSELNIWPWCRLHVNAFKQLGVPSPLSRRNTCANTNFTGAYVNFVGVRLLNTNIGLIHQVMNMIPCTRILFIRHDTLAAMVTKADAPLTYLRLTWKI
jgi:hypothetical protein